MRIHETQSGFSLVETLVAITILLIVIVGPMTIISTTSNSTSFASDQVTAFFLAQEGAELAQKARDDLFLQNDTNFQAGWDAFSNTNGTYRRCFISGGCGLEISDQNDGALELPIACEFGTACNLYYDDANNSVRARYTHANTGNPTPFLRRVIFNQVNANEVQVTSRVTWFTGSVAAEQQIEVETYLFNIYGN